MLILDIRTAQEFNQGHVCGAWLIPTRLPPLSRKDLLRLKNKLKEELKYVNVNQPILVYCKKGIRAGEAVKILNNLGYYKVINLGGVTLPEFWKHNLPICIKKH